MSCHDGGQRRLTAQDCEALDLRPGAVPGQVAGSNIWLLVNLQSATCNFVGHRHVILGSKSHIFSHHVNNIFDFS